MSDKNITQAVIVIHGMGEQLPMGTLRDFVDVVLPEAEDGIKYFSRPDSISSTYELRILQNRTRPRTHFFEYYWAHKVEGTKLNQVISWLRVLLIRSPTRVTRQLLPLWLISWGLVALFLLGFVLGWFEAGFFSLPIITPLLFALIQGFALNWIGDAARYLSPTPSNIKMRQTIRADGIDLLKKIHESGTYDRIIIVGHSLGSVIGYDILRHLWTEMNNVYDLPKKFDQAALLKVEELGEKLRAQDPQVTLEDYRLAQVELWKELREMGNPWLVTDFITLGSPLAHAALMLARDKDDLTMRQKQRELPTNPPTPELLDGKLRYSYDYYYYPYGKFKLKQYKPRVIHHAGLFAHTRWTNLFFPARLGLFGDIAGGPMQPWFGAGVKDIPVGSGNWFKNLTLIAHNSYWIRMKPDAGSKRTPVLKALIEALDLDAGDHFNEDFHPPRK